MASGYLYNGYCYADIASAGHQAAADMSRPVPFFEVAASGGVMYYNHGLQLPVCVYVTGSGQGASVQCSNKLLGRYSATSMSGLGISHNSLSPAGVQSTSVTFGACSVSGFAASTAADGVELGFLVGGALVLVSAVLFVGRRLS